MKARYRRRMGRRYLYTRFGVKASSSEADTTVTYATVRPERAPKDTRGRMLRAEAVIEHAEWELVWRAVRRCRFLPR